MGQWIELWPADPKVVGSIPGPGISLGGSAGAQLGVCKRQPIDVSLPLSPSFPLSLKIKIF